MQKSQTKKLRVQRETVRKLEHLADRALRGIAGGISGQRGCHSIQDRCSPGSGGALCASADDICPSGPGIASCGQPCPW
jgi:hypothetical protein